MKTVISLTVLAFLVACSANEPVPDPYPTYRPMVSQDGLYDNVTPVNKTSKGPHTHHVNPNGAP